MLMVVMLRCLSPAAAVGRPVVRKCMAGYNGSIFAYGQTGSGKTFTLMGQLDDPDLVRALPVSAGGTILQSILEL